MPAWLEELLGVNPLIKAGCAVWNWCMRLVSMQFGMSPATISGGEPWAEVVNHIYPVFLAVGATLVDIWCMVAYCRESVDLRQTFTSEKGIYILIKVIAANFVMTSALSWFPAFYSMASGLSVTDFHAMEMNATEIGSESGGFGLLSLTLWILSLLFLLTSAVCGLTIVFVVYRRVIDLLILVPLAPIALSSAAGGPGISRSAGAWFRTFLATNFQIVFMGLALRIGCKVIGNGTILTNAVESGFEFAHIFEMCFCMVLLVGLVKGSEGLLKRALALA